MLCGLIKYSIKCRSNQEFKPQNNKRPVTCSFSMKTTRICDCSACFSLSLFEKHTYRISNIQSACDTSAAFCFKNQFPLVGTKSICTCTEPIGMRPKWFHADIPRRYRRKLARLGASQNIRRYIVQKNIPIFAKAVGSLALK